MSWELFMISSVETDGEAINFFLPPSIQNRADFTDEKSHFFYRARRALTVYGIATWDVAGDRNSVRGPQFSNKKLGQSSLARVGNLRCVRSLRGCSANSRLPRAPSRPVPWPLPPTPRLTKPSKGIMIKKNQNRDKITEKLKEGRCRERSLLALHSVSIFLFFAAS